MCPGYQGPLDDSLNQNKRHKHDALSGDDNLGELPGNDPASDRRLKHYILEKLSKHVEIDSSRVEVAVKDCFVSLTGSVDSEQTRATIKSLVEGIDGVEDVVSYIELKDPLR